MTHNKRAAHDVDRLVRVFRDVARARGRARWARDSQCVPGLRKLSVQKNGKMRINWPGGGRLGNCRSVRKEGQAGDCRETGETCRGTCS